MKKIIALLVAIMAITCTQAQAQEYKTAIGVRVGVGMSGIDVKHNLNAINSIEGILDFSNGFNLVGLYEFNTQISADFNFYYGVGGNIGIWGGNDDFTLGIDGIVGIEYIIPNVPFAISLDYKPFINLTGATGFHETDFGLGIKYIF